MVVMINYLIDSEYYLSDLIFYCIGWIYLIYPVLVIVDSELMILMVLSLMVIV